ncbi:MAG: transporter substrate-binding domain-containing protein [Chloroflexota bacterium]|jgi:PAS domain S-box-containing protein
MKHKWVARLTVVLLVGVWLFGFRDGYTRGTAQVIPSATPTAPAAGSPERRVIRVAGDQTYPPFEFLDNGVPSGFNVDLIHAIAAEMDFEVEVTLGAWSEVRQGLLDGKYDLLLGMVPTAERDKVIDFSVPYTYIAFDLFVPSDSNVSTLDDLRGKTVVVQTGGLMQEYLQSQNYGAEPILVQDVSNALRLIHDGVYDAALLNRLQGQFLISELGLSNVRRVGSEILPSKYGMAVKDGNKELLARLNEGLYLVSNSGQLNEIQEKWFGVYESRPTWQLLRPWIFGLGGAGGLLLLSLLVAWSLRKQVDNRTRQLRRSEEKYRQLVENAREGVVVSCGDVLVFANPAAAAITGYAVDELIGMKIANLIHPDDLLMVMDRYRRRLLGEDVPAYYAFRLINRARETRWAQVHAVTIEWEKTAATLDMFIDITDQRRAEEQVQQQLRHMAALRAVDMAITASMDLTMTLRVVLEQVTMQLGADAASVLLLEDETQQLVYAAGQGFRGGLERDLRIRMGEGYAGQAALKRRTVRVADLAQSADNLRTEEWVREEGFVSYISLPLISKGQVKGVLEIFHRAAWNINAAWMNFVEALANQAAIAIDNAQLLKNLKSANLDLTLAYDDTIAGWARALELRDGNTEGHSQRVADLTVELAAAMGVRGEALVHIRRGAILHDIGKMAIPDSILKKTSTLTDAEWQVMKMHPVYSFNLLSEIEFLRPALDIPYGHHERWDGSGYPRGLRGGDISLAARIFAVVDVWDALTDDRLYRPGWKEHEALEYIRSLSGAQFDPRVVEVFCALMEKRLNAAD